jgi:teichuronic acid biosynthesis glycosyltransferase TuaC
MRILCVLGGYGEEHLAGEVHRELAREIRAGGHDYEVFAPVHRRDMTGRTPDAVEDGIPVHRVVCGGTLAATLLGLLSRPLFRYPWFLAALLGLLRLLGRRPPYDAILAETVYPLGAIVWLATRVRRAPFVVSVAGGDFLSNEVSNYGYGRYRIPRRLMAASFRKAAVVRCISPYAAENAAGLGCPREKLAVVQRNIGERTFGPEGDGLRAFRQAARARVDARLASGSGPLVAAVGRLLPIKGFDDLLRALPEVAAGAPDVRLVLVGPNRVDSRLGDYQRHLEELAESLGVGERVQFIGPVPLGEVRDFLAAADVVAIPSIEEGGNKVLLEAAAVGTPFVSTRTAGNAELARPWDCGLVVEPRAPSALAAAIGRLLRDHAEARAMGERGRVFAEQFRARVVAARMVGLCELAARGEPLTDELRMPAALARGYADLSGPARAR